MNLGVFNIVTIVMGALGMFLVVQIQRDIGGMVRLVI